MKTTSWYRSLLPIVLLSCNALCVTGCVGTIGASEEEVGRDEGLLSALNALLADNVFPIAGSTRQSCSDSYGDPRPNGRTHQGIDCFAPKGTELVAVEDGFIRYARPGGPFSCKEGGDFSGNRISLTGTSGTRYYYGHLENIYVSNGLPVKKGQTIGTVGNTGNALCSVPHLHFEISIPPKYSTIDPFPVMATWGATSGTDQGSPTPSGNDQGSPMPSGNDQGSPMPSGNDQGSPMPSGNDQGSPMPSGNDQGSPMPPIQSVTLHRMYADGDHFYTISQQEVDFALGLGYGLEDYVGVGECYPAPTMDTVPLYRLWNPAIGDHFYTTSLAERNAVIAPDGYQDEGTACWVHVTQIAGTCPLYRMYSEAATDHFYTLSQVEVWNAAAHSGYKLEGNTPVAYMRASNCPQ